MTGRWWRAYDEALHDPKLIALSDKLHRAWFNLLCIASKHGGILPAMNVVAIELRVTIHKAAEWVTALVVAGLVDEIEPGKFAPHNWGRRQFQSDVSTDRVKRFRERERNVSETPPDTETEAENRNRDEKTDSCAVAPATRTDVDQPFDEFWKAYPKREGANPRKPALAAFLAKLKTGVEPAEIIAGAKACAIRDRDKIGTPYIPQAVKWLRDERWRDYAAPVAAVQPNGWRPGLPTDEELRAKYERRTNGHEPSPDRNGTAQAGASATEPADGADHEQELFPPRNGAHPGEQLGSAGNGRKPDAQSLGHVLSRSLVLDAVVPDSARDGPDPRDDATGTMAGVVRS